MAVLTVEQVLRMPVLRAAGPEVVAGAAGLHRHVRWVHSAELADIASLLRGGDLLLSTGIALPELPRDLEVFAESLAASEAAGVCIELGRRWSVLPADLVVAFDRLDLPLVALTREVGFAAVAQAVGERLVDEQIEDLREAERVHETFTELSIAEAGPSQILQAVQRLSGAAVVLENDQHRVVDYRPGPTDIGAFLANWQSRSRAVTLDGRTSWDSRNGWLVTQLGRRDRGWGRLVVEAPTQPPQRLVAVAERAAAALAMHRLQDRDRDSLTRRTHHELLVGLLIDPTDVDLLRRCELAGLPTVRRQFVGLTLRAQATTTAGGTHERRGVLDDVIASVAHACHELRVPSLACEMHQEVRVLLSVPSSADVDRTTEQISARVRRRHSVVVSAGRTASRVGEIDRTLRESQHVAASVRADAVQRTVHRLDDVHLRGLLALLGDDERLRLFVDRELDSLKRHDAQQGSTLFPTLKALLCHPGSKSDAAASLHLSRPAFYDRLSKIERVLAVDLDDPDIRVSLHVAVIADEIAPSGTST